MRVTGSAFNASLFIPLNAASNATRVGNMRFEFSADSGNAATLTCDVNGQRVLNNIQRQVFGAFQTECSPP